MVRMAARISSGWSRNELSNTWAVPANCPVMVGGIFTSRSSSRMAMTASPSVKPGARLKVMVTAGSWLWRATETGPGASVTDATASRRTCWPRAAAEVDLREDAGIERAAPYRFPG